MLFWQISTRHLSFDSTVKIPTKTCGCSSSVFFICLIRPKKWSCLNSLIINNFFAIHCKCKCHSKQCNVLKQLQVRFKNFLRSFRFASSRVLITLRFAIFSRATLKSVIVFARVPRQLPKLQTLRNLRPENTAWEFVYGQSLLRLLLCSDNMWSKT